MLKNVKMNRGIIKMYRISKKRDR